MITSLLTIGDARLRRRLLLITLLAAIIGLVEGAAYGCVIPLLRSFGAGGTAAAQQWLCVLAALAVVNVILLLIAGQLGRSGSASLTGALLKKMGSVVLGLPHSWFTARSAGQMAAMATSGIGFAGAMPHAVIRPAVSAVTTPFAIAAIVLFVDWRVGLALIIGAPFLVVATRKIGAISAEADHEHGAAVASLTSRLIESVQCQEVLRASDDTSAASRLVEEAVARQHEAFAHATKTQGSAMASLGKRLQCVWAAAASVAVVVWASQPSNLLTLVGILIVLTRFCEPILVAGGLYGGFRNGIQTLAALRELEKLPGMSEPDAPAQPSGSAIAVSHLSTGYGRVDRPVVLDDVSFTIPEGSFVAVVGPSGCGKTTLLKSILRLIEPSAGVVTLGGVSVKSLGSRGVRSQISPVFQSSFLLNGSIRENVVLGNPSVSDEELDHAAAAVGLDGVIRRLPSGWDSAVGEGGSSLSGGERQRVALARAWLRRTPVMLLDEPTASVDALTQATVISAVQRREPGQSVLMISHRLASVVMADLIVVLDETGRVTQTGTHEELLARPGQYAKAWDLQHRAESWKLGEERTSATQDSA